MTFEIHEENVDVPLKGGFSHLKKVFLSKPENIVLEHEHVSPCIRDCFMHQNLFLRRFFFKCTARCPNLKTFAGKDVYNKHYMFLFNMNIICTKVPVRQKCKEFILKNV